MQGGCWNYFVGKSPELGVRDAKMNSQRLALHKALAPKLADRGHVGHTHRPDMGRFVDTRMQMVQFVQIY